jgi:hypothetical protein
MLPGLSLKVKSHKRTALIQGQKTDKKYPHGHVVDKKVPVLLIGFFKKNYI